MNKENGIDGMYLRAPHNHAKWLELKKKRIEERNTQKSGKRKAAAASSSSSSASNDTNKQTKTSKGNSGKLALSKSFLAGLTTTFLCSKQEATEFFDKHYDAADDSSKE